MTLKNLAIAALALVFAANSTDASAQKKTLREHGFPIGIFETGKNNAVTDVPGVTVGQVTCIEGDSIRTGVTAIIPHQGNIF
ncbi:MAG: P1 family peptidase [Bacteroidales bacterium]|nr:P1 family peptidase [Bacteroidales bacterium]